jgi:hypothetical protein
MKTFSEWLEGTETMRRNATSIDEEERKKKRKEEYVLDVLSQIYEMLHRFECVRSI